MRIDVLTNDGSPLGVTSRTIWGDGFRVGVGGAELALLTMCEEWTKAGHEVILYNNPWEVNASPFGQKPISAFDALGNRDVLIVFRSPNPRAIVAKAKLKVWWSCDQQTIGDYAKFAPHVDKIVCISPYHAEYFSKTYNINRAIVIDPPVRFADFENLPLEKDLKQIIFTSIPTRGLANLRGMWPVLAEKVPGVSLVITSDYRLWGAPTSGNATFVAQWITQGNVQFLGALPRQEYLARLAHASILLYPCSYDELFCYSVAEAGALGTYPITSSIGALVTTNMGTVIDKDANNPANYSAFIEEAVKLLENPSKLIQLQNEIVNKSRERFHPEVVLKQWEERVFQ